MRLGARPGARQHSAGLSRRVARGTGCETERPQGTGPAPGATDGDAHSSGVDSEHGNMREIRPLFGSADRRHADRQSDWVDYSCIVASAICGLLLWMRGERTLALLPILFALHWGFAKWRDRQSDLMDYFCIAVLAVSGLWLWSRSGWMLALLPIGISLQWGLAKWRERRIEQS